MSPKPKEDGEEVSTQTKVEGQGEESKLFFVKMSPEASTPTKGSKLAAGYDLIRSPSSFEPFYLNYIYL
jgi:hypothetical protein